MIYRWIKRLAVSLALLILIALIAVKYRYGGGEDFPDRSGTPRLPATALELVAELPTPPGNIAVSSDGRVFATLHPEARPTGKVVEIVNGQPVEWPDASWQDPTRSEQAFRNVLSVRIDRQNRLWALDNGDHGIHPARLLSFDLSTNQLHSVHEFDRSIAGLGSHLNDFQISSDGQWIYIADASFFGKTPALLVHNTQTGVTRRLLQGHPSVSAEHFTPVVQGRSMEILGLLSIRPGVDSIGLDKQDQWLYFAPITNLNLYRIRTEDLRNAQISAVDLAGRVEIFGAKTMSDGITLDRQGTIYLSDLEHSAIVTLRQDRSLQTLIQDQRLRWPDGFSFGPQGWLYVTCSALHQVFGRLPGQISAAGPFQIFRLKPGAEGIAGQ